jgi:hypothetical protein
MLIDEIMTSRLNIKVFSPIYQYFLGDDYFQLELYSK